MSSPTPRRRSTRRNSDLSTVSASEEIPISSQRKPIQMMEIDEENEDVVSINSLQPNNTNEILVNSDSPDVVAKNEIDNAIKNDLKLNEKSKEEKKETIDINSTIDSHTDKQQISDKNEKQIKEKIVDKVSVDQSLTDNKSIEIHEKNNITNNSTKISEIDDTICDVVIIEKSADNSIQNDKENKMLVDSTTDSHTDKQQISDKDGKQTKEKIDLDQIESQLSIQEIKDNESISNDLNPVDETEKESNANANIHVNDNITIEKNEVDKGKNECVEKGSIDKSLTNKSIEIHDANNLTKISDNKICDEVIIEPSADNSIESDKENKILADTSDDVEITELSNKTETSIETAPSADGNNESSKSAKKVMFENQTPNRTSIISYPKTPISLSKIDGRRISERISNATESLDNVQEAEKYKETDTNEHNSKVSNNIIETSSNKHETDISCEMSDADVSLASDVINDDESCTEQSENSIQNSQDCSQDKMATLRINESSISSSSTSAMSVTTSENLKVIKEDKLETEPIKNIEISDVSLKEQNSNYSNLEIECKTNEILNKDEEIDENIASLANHVKRKLNDVNDSINIQANLTLNESNIPKMHTPFTTKRRRIASSSTPIVKKIKYVTKPDDNEDEVENEKQIDNNKIETEMESTEGTFILF